METGTLDSINFMCPSPIPRISASSIDFSSIIFSIYYIIIVIFIIEFTYCELLKLNNEEILYIYLLAFHKPTNFFLLEMFKPKNGTTNCPIEEY